MRATIGLQKVITTSTRTSRQCVFIGIAHFLSSPPDTAAASQRGDKPGGDIMIHGIRNGLGCSALFIAASIGPLVASLSQTKRLRRFTAQSQMERLSTFDHDT